MVSDFGGSSSLMSLRTLQAIRSSSGAGFNKSSRGSRIESASLAQDKPSCPLGSLAYVQVLFSEFSQDYETKSQFHRAGAKRE